MRANLTIALFATAIALGQSNSSLVPSNDGLTVYDSNNKITWLADANLAATNRFGLPLCGAAQEPCVNPSGSMTYPSAVAWVKAMNAANYLGHSDWLLPVTPQTGDSNCGFNGAGGIGFGYGCTANAYAALYNALGFKPANTAVPVLSNKAGPFSNFQPYLYWSQTSAGSSGMHTFSFATGWRGANIPYHVMYTLPMVPGKIPGTPPATGKGLQVNLGGQTVYDPITNVTWLADANIAATNQFGLPFCTKPGTPNQCVFPDGGMNFDSATQLIANMNAAAYLGQKNWQVPYVDTNCSGFGCSGPNEPMGNLFYNQLGLTAGTPVVSTPDVATGPFHRLQPYLYWGCGAAALQDACQSSAPVANQGWSYSFGNGFLGTDLQANNLYVMAYFPGARASTSGPVIAEVANAEGDIPIIAPNTWLQIKGAGLAPPGDSRVWQTADFSGTQMPVQLDKVSATVNGKSAFVYFISPSQLNILTPPDALSGPVQVVVTNNGQQAAFTAQAQPISPSLFVFNGGPYVAAVHLNGTLIGPATLYPGATSAAKPGETILLFANGFGPTSVPEVSGSIMQSGTLSPLPQVQIGNKNAVVQFAGLVEPGEFQFNIVIPDSVPDGDQPVTVTYNNAGTQPGTLLTIARR